VRVLPDQVGAEAVDQQDGHPPGAGERGGQAQRVGGEVTAVHRHAERRGGARQDVGQRGGAVGRPVQVGRQELRRHQGRVARTCRPVATSR
jgi:hypothetical protein